MEVHAVDTCDEGWQDADGADDGQDLHAVILFDADEAECGVQQKLDLVDGLGVEVVEGCDVSPGDLDAGFEGLWLFLCSVADIDQDAIKAEQAVADHGGEVAAVAEAAEGFAQHFGGSGGIAGAAGTENAFGDGVEVSAEAFQNIGEAIYDFLNDFDEDFVDGRAAFGWITFGLPTSNDIEAIIVSIADRDEMVVRQDEADGQGKGCVFLASDEGSRKIEGAILFVMAGGAFDFFQFIPAGNMGVEGLFCAGDLVESRVDEVEPDRFGDIDVRSGFPGRSACGAHEEHQADP